MKLNFSRIKETRDTYKSNEEIVLELYKDRNNFIDYEQIESENIVRKLVFKNVNHKRMLHKHFAFEHFYIVLAFTISICLYQVIKENYLMSVIVFIVGLVLMLKLLSESDVPYKLVFDGLSIYEINHLGKRIMEFAPLVVESSDSDKYNNDFVFLSSNNSSLKNGENMKSLMIISNDNSFDVKRIFRNYFNVLSFKANIK